MRIGTIKFFNAGKGFGFVTPDGGEADIFLPAAALTASGMENVKPGLRVSFEQAPDARGPKVIALKLLEAAPVKAPPPPQDRVSVYCDPGSDLAADILDEVRDAGYQLQLIDYVGTPQPPDQLQRLSHILGQAGQSLVRRYDPLFLALQLDDRFITDQDFWTGIAEHPALINGPVLLHGGRARICRSADEASAFLNKSADPAPSPKSLSPRIAAMLKGEAVPAAAAAPVKAAPVKIAPVKVIPPEKPQPAPAPKPVKILAPKVAPNPVETPKKKAAVKPAAAKVEKKPVPKKAAAKPAPKAKKPVKKSRGR